MKNILVFIVSLIIFTGCQSNDTKFCECIKVSEEFNQINSEILSGKKSKEKYVAAKNLLERKRKLCFDYKHTQGEELLQKKRACK